MTTSFDTTKYDAKNKADDMMAKTAALRHLFTHPSSPHVQQALYYIVTRSIDRMM
jgi:hypothetical protein